MADASDGGLFSQPTPEEMEQQLIAVVVHEVFNALAQFSQVDSNVALQQAQASAKEQMEVIKTILPTLHPSHPASQSHPTFVVHIRNRATQVQGMVEAPKLLQGVQDPGLAIHNAFLFALLMCPAARALLTVHGFDIRFSQSTKVIEEPRKSKLIISKS